MVALSPKVPAVAGLSGKATAVACGRWAGVAVDLSCSPTESTRGGGPLLEDTQCSPAGGPVFAVVTQRRRCRGRGGPRRRDAPRRSPLSCVGSAPKPPACGRPYRVGLRLGVAAPNGHAQRLAAYGAPLVAPMDAHNF